MKGYYCIQHFLAQKAEYTLVDLSEIYDTIFLCQESYQMRIQKDLQEAQDTRQVFYSLAISCSRFSDKLRY